MKKIIVRKKLTIAMQFAVVGTIVLSIYLFLTVLQWQDSKNRLQKIAKLQQVGMVEYANLKLEDYFEIYPASIEAYRLKLNGLLKIQSSIIHLQENELSENFVNLVAENSNSISKKSTSYKNQYFSVSTKIISIIFDMKVLGLISETEKNQLLAVAYFKLGKNYFNLSRDYFSLVLKENYLDKDVGSTYVNSVYNRRIVLEALIRMHDYFGEFDDSLAMLERIEKMQGENAQNKLRIAKYLFLNQHYESATEVLEKSLQNQTASLNIDLSIYLPCAFFLIELLDFRGKTSLADHYLSLLRYRTIAIFAKSATEIENKTKHFSNDWAAIQLQIDNFATMREAKQGKFTFSGIPEVDGINGGNRETSKDLENEQSSKSPNIKNAFKLPDLYVFTSDMLKYW